MEGKVPNTVKRSGTAPVRLLLLSACIYVGSPHAWGDPTPQSALRGSLGPGRASDTADPLTNTLPRGVFAALLSN